MKLKVVLSIVLSSVLIVGLAVTGLIFYNRPQTVAFSAPVKAIRNLAERDEFSFISASDTDGSIAFNIGSMYDTVEEKELIENPVSAKMYFSEDAFFLDDLSIKHKESQLLLDAYVGKDKFYISEDNVLGEAFGAKMGDLLASFEESVFAYDSGSIYALDEILHRSIVTSIKNVENDSLKKDREKLTENVLKDITRIVSDSVEIKSANKNISLGAKRKNARQITVTVEAENLVKIIEEVFDYLDGNDEIIDFLEEHNDAIVSDTDSEENKTAVELYEQVLEEIEKQLDSLTDSIEESDDVLKIEIATPMIGHKLQKMSVEYNHEKIFVVDLGADGIKRTDRISIETAKNTLTYKINQNDKAAYRSFLKIDGVAEAKINFDKAEGSYSVDIAKTDKNGSYSLVLTGKHSVTRDTVFLSVDKISSETKNNDSTPNDPDHQAEIEVDISYTVKIKDRMPETKSTYKKLDELTDSNITRVLSTLSIVNPEYANEVNRFAAANRYYSYGKVLKDLGEHAIDLTGFSEYGRMRSGVILAVIGCENADEIETKIRSGKTIEGLVITIDKGSAIKAEYRELTYADLK